MTAVLLVLPAGTSAPRPGAAVPVGAVDNGDDDDDDLTYAALLVVASARLTGSDPSDGEKTLARKVTVSHSKLLSSLGQTHVPHEGVGLELITVRIYFHSTLLPSLRLAEKERDGGGGGKERGTIS